jgi:hypothetical protein
MSHTGVSEVFPEVFPDATGASDERADLNPKDVAARKGGKPQLSLVEPALKAGIAYAMKDGVEKYGLRNYLYKPIRIRTYTDALQRHIDDFVNGEQWASDSGVHHLDHAAACLNVLMGALAYGVAIDDRFPEEMHDEHPPITEFYHHNPDSSTEPGE